MVLKIKNIIKNILKEELEDQRKKFFHKLWDKEKKEKGIAIYDSNLLKKFGVNQKNEKDVWNYYLEWVGGKTNPEGFIEYLEGKEFDSKDFLYLKDEYPNTHFIFILYDVNLNETEKKVMLKYNIIWGYTTDPYSFERANVETENNQIEDMMDYFDFQDMVKDSVSDFVSILGSAFGLKIEYVKLEEKN